MGLAHKFACLWALMPLAAGAQEPVRKPRVTALRFDGSGQKLAAGADDGSVTLWDVAGARALWSVEGHGSAVQAVFFRAGDSQVLAADRGGDLRVLGAESGRRVRDLMLAFGVFLNDEEERLQDVDLDPSGDRLAIAGDVEESVVVIDLPRALAPPETQFPGFGRVSLIHLRDGTLNIYPEANFVLHTPGSRKHAAVIRELREGDAAFRSVRLCSKGRFLAAVAVSGRLVVWDLEKATDVDEPEDDRYIRKIGPDALALGCSATDALITVGKSGKYGEVQLWKTASGEMVQQWDMVGPLQTRRAAFDHSGTWAITTGLFRYTLWQVTAAGMKPAARFYLTGGHGPQGLPGSVAFSPRQPLVALGDRSDVFLLQLPNLELKGILGGPMRRTKIEVLMARPE